VGRDCTQTGGSIVRSRILLVGLVLTPAALVATGYSSLGEAKGDDCKAKPDSSAPAGLHWYYRVDRANNRHCWYLHGQGMPVHSFSHAMTRNPDTQNDVDPQNDTADEQVWKTPPITGTPQPYYEQSATPAEPLDANFTARWVDLPKSVDLNAHDPNSASNGYAAEQDVESGQGELPRSLAGVSTVNSDARQNAGPQTSFGSISLAGAAVLALLLISEALIRFLRAAGWSLPRRRVRLEPAYYSEAPPSAPDATPDRGWNSATDTESLVREHSEIRELRGLLERAGTGLRPPRSFAPSRSAQRGGHADSHARAHSAFERLKSRSFSGMNWAPL
jgi:hypothetical protein